MGTIASEGRMRRLGGAVQCGQPISGEVKRGAVSALSAVALSALSAVAVSAQQNQPRSQEAPAAAPAPVSPASPSRASPPQNVSQWQQALVAQLGRFKRYPAQAHGAEGVASLAFAIDRKGNLLSSRIATSSGSPILDAEAVALVKRAAPFPPPPAEIADADLSFVVPIRFTADEQH